MEVKLSAGEVRFSVTGLETGKRYIVTITAYRGNKRSRVAQTIFKTGLLKCFAALVKLLIHPGHLEVGQIEFGHLELKASLVTELKKASWMSQWT